MAPRLAALALTPDDAAQVQAAIRAAYELGQTAKLRATPDDDLAAEVIRRGLAIPGPETTE
jgi:hypothetical protein